MSKLITLAASVGAPQIDIALPSRVRFHFKDRWKTLGLPDAWIEVGFHDSKDAIEVYGDSGLVLAAVACNKVTIASMDMYGGEAEITESRLRIKQLVQQVNVAQDPMRKKHRR